MTHRRAVSSGTTFLNNLIASPFPAPKSANTPKGGDNLHLFDFVTKGMYNVLCCAWYFKWLAWNNPVYQWR